MSTHWEVQMGGAQYQAKCLLDALADRSDVDIFYLAHRVPQRRQQDGYQIVQLSASWHGVGRSLTGFWPVYRTLKRLRPTIIYLRGLTAYTGVCASYCVRHGAKLVFHIAHDSDVSRAKFALWNPLTPIRQLERRIAEYGMRRANVIIAQTKDQAGMLQRKFGIDATAVIPNFHPIPRVNDSRREVGRVRVLWVANFKAMKNPEIFVNLAEAFTERNDVEFIMIGRPGHKDRYAQLHTRIKKLSNLQYRGELPIEQVNEELARSDIFVNTSSAEGFPNTFIQAWLRGTPVVSCFVDPDACLSRGKAGIVAGSPERLISVVRELLDDRPRIRELGESAREYAFANHGPESAQKLVALVLSGSPGQVKFTT